MKVAVLHLGRTAAGPQLTLELAHALSREGVAPVVVYSANAEIAESLAAVCPSSLAVRTFTSARGAVMGLLRLPRLARRIDDFLVAHDVDVVVVTMEQIWQALISPVLRRHGRRVLLFVHDATIHPGEDSRLARWLRTRERSQADGVIVLSEHVADALAGQGAFDTQRIWRTVHPAFVTAHRTQPRALDPNKPPIIGFFGRMSKYKGLQLGVDALTELRSRGTRVRLLVAGSNVPSDITHLTHPDTVVDDRWIPQAEVEATISQCDIMLLPYTEASQSGVLAYAMALGIPVVVTPVGGLPEQVRQTGAGVVAAEVSATALADALDEVIGDPTLYSSLSAAGLRSAATEYSWHRVARDVDAAAASLMALPPR